MKQLVCEMCNSNDLPKDGDYFICQHTPYDDQDWR